MSIKENLEELLLDKENLSQEITITVQKALSNFCNKYPTLSPSVSLSLRYIRIEDQEAPINIMVDTVVSLKI